jgi:protein-S-isoprenylcysteine O-methyltransferase Ste14
MAGYQPANDTDEGDAMSRRHGGRKHQRERSDLIGEHPFGDAGQLMFACLFFVVWGLDTFLLKATIWLNPHIPLWARIAFGSALLVASGYLAAKGLSIVFGEIRDQPRVIRKSVFGVVRHPIYLSEIVLYLGFLVISLSFAAAMVWAGAFLFLHFISHYEERLLLQRFGDDYARYMREVPMWLPRLWKRPR